MLSPKYKPLILGAVTLGSLDALGIAAMIANPESIDRVIPALVAIQVLGILVVAFIYWSRRQWREMDATISGDLSIETDRKQRTLKRRRWGALTIAVIGILQTPSAIHSAIGMVQADHIMAFVMVIAFAIRFAVIWFFFRFFWQTRPQKQ